jgi:hypothetical protein
MELDKPMLKFTCKRIAKENLEKERELLGHLFF